MKVLKLYNVTFELKSNNYDQLVLGIILSIQFFLTAKRADVELL